MTTVRLAKREIFKKGLKLQALHFSLYSSFVFTRSKQEEIIGTDVYVSADERE